MRLPREPDPTDAEDFSDEFYEALAVALIEAAKRAEESDGEGDEG